MTSFSPPAPVPPKAAVPISLVIIALALGSFAIGTAEFAAMSLLPYYAPALHVSEAEAGYAISAYALGVVIGAPILAMVGTRFSRKTFLLYMMGIYTIGNGLTAFSESFNTMLVLRFISGLPHGAYLGFAALVAATLVPREKRTRAVAQVILGLMLATIFGAPLADIIGQTIGWRFGFGLVALLSLITILMVAKLVPYDRPGMGKSWRTELPALKNRKVWITLLIGAIGNGGMFAVYTYLSPTLSKVAMAEANLIPIALAIFGAGMTAGTLIAAAIADKAPMRSAGALMLWSACFFVLYAYVADTFWLVCLMIFCAGCGGGLGSILQTRLMDVAGKSQNMAAALNHSSFNMANALGPFLAGIAIDQGYGYASTGFVGAGLAVAGIAIWLFACFEDKRTPIAHYLAKQGL
jgi:DHA1 family inner membrane transport protein